MSLYVLERADPRQLSVNVTSSSGRVFRWGPDESDASSIPAGMTITTQMPGGFGAMHCDLQRRPDLTYYDLDRFAPCTVTGAGGALTAFDGYLSSRPMNRGDSYSFSPEAIGWSGHLKDNASFSMVYIDRQLSKWTPPSYTREAAFNSAGFSYLGTTGALVDGTGNPALQLLQTTPFGKTEIEMIYDSGANNVIARIAMSNITRVTYGAGNLSLSLTARVWSDDHNGNEIIGPSSSDATSMDWTPSTAQRWAVLDYTDSGTGISTATGTSYGFYCGNVQVHGNHGLTRRVGPSGNASPSVDDGYYGGDIVAHIIQTACPLLTTTRGVSAGSVWNDTFVVPQLSFNTPVSPDTAMQQLNQYYLYDYGVYENKAFFWQPPGSGRVWHLRVGDGVKVTDQGPQIETAFNGVVVQYTDPAGQARYVGPPGYAGDKDPVSGNTSSALLQDTSSTNPCNQYGRTRRALLQMGTTTWQGAVTVGQIFLATAGARPSSGSAIVKGFAQDSNGRDWPVWMIRSGDTVIFDDTNDQSSHYILSTSYAHDSLTNTLTLDAPPNRLDWLIQRLGLSISALG